MPHGALIKVEVIIILTQSLIYLVLIVSSNLMHSVANNGCHPHPEHATLHRQSCAWMSLVAGTERALLLEFGLLLFLQLLINLGTLRRLVTVVGGLDEG